MNDGELIKCYQYLKEYLCDINDLNISINKSGIIDVKDSKSNIIYQADGVKDLDSFLMGYSRAMQSSTGNIDSCDNECTKKDPPYSLLKPSNIKFKTGYYQVTPYSIKLIKEGQSIALPNPLRPVNPLEVISVLSYGNDGFKYTVFLDNNDSVNKFYFQTIVNLIVMLEGDA